LDRHSRQATVSVGIAAAALEAGIELGKSKTAAFNATPLREQQLPQFQIGKARALIEAARATFIAPPRQPMTSARYGSAGRMMLGLEPDPNLFWLNL
jgi:alkylation response protein AidB-like acyl-CoA dehydrogenase